MVNETDIIHMGLREIFQTTTTARPDPPQNLHRHCYRGLYALNLATSLSHQAMAGIRLQPGSGPSGHEMPIQNNKIKFEWNNGYAIDVDWL
jgi:hypothetical protein